MSQRLVCTACGHLWPIELLVLRRTERCLICAGDLVDEAEHAAVASPHDGHGDATPTPQ